MGWFPPYELVSGTDGLVSHAYVSCFRLGWAGRLKKNVPTRALRACSYQSSHTPSQVVCNVPGGLELHDEDRVAARSALLASADTCNPLEHRATKRRGCDASEHSILSVKSLLNRSNQIDLHRGWSCHRRIVRHALKSPWHIFVALDNTTFGVQFLADASVALYIALETMRRCAIT